MAEFLRHTPALDMRAVGEYLANRKEFNGQVRKAFMDKFPFAGLGLTEAVRMLLSSCGPRLPAPQPLGLHLHMPNLPTKNLPTKIA